MVSAFTQTDLHFHETSQTVGSNNKLNKNNINASISTYVFILVISIFQTGTKPLIM